MADLASDSTYGVASSSSKEDADNTGDPNDKSSARDGTDDDPQEAQTTESLYIHPADDDDRCYLCLELMPPWQSFVDPPARLRSICCGKECCEECRNRAFEVTRKETLRAATSLGENCSINFATGQIESKAANASDTNSGGRRKKGRGRNNKKKKGKKAGARPKTREEERNRVSEVVSTAMDRINSCNLCRSELPMSPKEEFKVLLAHSEKGVVWAIGMLANFYRLGVGVDVDESKYVHWTKIGAAKGNARSQFLLGMWRVNGFCNTPVNKAEARRLFSSSAEKNDACAQFWYGIMLHNGEGGHQDAGESFRYMTYAARNGFADAQVELGKWYYSDRGDLRMAILWAAKGAQSDHVEGSFLLGCWMIMDAQQRLGSEFVTGKSPMPVALKWLRSAASRGHADAKRHVNLCMSVIESRCEHCCERRVPPAVWCDRCRAAKYCNISCKRANWKAGHQHDCVNLESE